MLKLRTYYYSKSGEFLNSNQLSKASWFRLKNKAFEIDLVEAFPPKLKVSEKLDYVEYFKSELNKEFFQEDEQSSLFDIRDDWSYITFDNKGNELYKPVNKKSKFFSIFKNYEIKYSDTFPSKFSNDQKKSYINSIIDEIIEEEEGLKALEQELFFTEKKYYSNILNKASTSSNYVVKFPNNPSWSKFKEELKEKILNHAKESRDFLLSMRTGQKSFLWQFVALLVPIDDDGQLTHDHKQFISTPQLGNFKFVYDDMIDQIEGLEKLFLENYQLDFENADIGFREFTLCLIQ